MTVQEQRAPQIGDRIQSGQVPGKTGVIIALDKAWWAPEYRYCCQFEGSSLEHNLRLDEFTLI